MIRLFLVVGLAVALWPIDDNNQALSMAGVSISSTDMLVAAHSVYSDVSQFCERNAEACVTGKQVYLEVSDNIQAQLQNLASGQKTGS